MLKEKIVNFEREHRIVPKVIAATSALSVASIAASAEGSTVTSDLDTVTSAMTTSLTDLVGKAAVACAGVVGVALTIFGIKWVVKTIRGFFSSVAK